ncbi:MAG: hypothetical protein ACPGLV_09990 [Bacteroidia bacterium]
MKKWLKTIWNHELIHLIGSPDLIPFCGDKILRIFFKDIDSFWFRLFSYILGFSVLLGFFGILGWIIKFLAKYPKLFS